MRQLVKKIANLIRKQRGSSMPETLVGMGILGIVGVCFLTSLTTGIHAVGTVDAQATAQLLAQVQMEDTKNQDYLVAPTTYPTTVNAPDGYSVTVAALSLPDADDDIQKIEVTVRHEGRVLIVLEDYKVNLL